MSQFNNIDFDLEGIGDYIKGNRLTVPIYQRPYSWEESQVDDYIADLSSAFKEATSLKGKNDIYFLGTIVVSTEGGESSVIDGQQRLATTSLLLAAIRDRFKAEGVSTWDTIQSEYLSRKVGRTGEIVPNLSLSADDNDFFRRFVVGVEEVPDNWEWRKSHERIQKNYDLLRAFVTKLKQSAGHRWEEELWDWVDFLQQKVVVVAIEVSSEADAFQIFETLNDRGADLTIADLLKNYLFGQAGKRIDEVRDRWVEAATLVESADEKPQLTTVLRQYWSSKVGITRERDLYNRIKASVSSADSALAFVDELKVAATHYAALKSPEHEFWSNFGSDTAANVETLNRLKLEQARPLLFAAMQYFTNAELKSLLQAMVSWSVRGLIVGGLGGGTFEKAYSDAAVKVRNGEIKTTDGVRDSLRKIIPDDDTFEQHFASAVETRSRIARYYLITLERSRKNEAEPELVPNEDETQVNLEHILPKKATSAADSWPQFTSAEIDNSIHRLGNMALLPATPNTKIGNKPWHEKKPILSISAFDWTKEAGMENDWTAQVIRDRQKKMAREAVKAWPI